MKKIIIILFISYSLFAQVNEFNPNYNWYTIKGKHVRVHFHDGAERTAKVVAKIADEIWSPITSLYQFEPETVDYVIKDIDDYSNGATYFFDNKIEIWASSLDFDLRGTHNWLRNVISHEFTHMVQIQSAIKFSRTLPIFYLQFLNYEDKRRPDILYGFPNFIASYPIPGINVPAWFAEGTAQYMRKDFNYDNWDTHRDMILRSYALENKMLTWNQMSVFDKTSLGNESVYNSGFALTRYISQKYGEDKLRLISHKLGKLTNFTIDAAFSDVLRKNGIEIYNEWKTFLTDNYKERSKDILSNLVTGEIIAKEGFGNFHPTFSKDGKKLLYISNKSNDYFSLSSLYLYDLETKKEKLISNGVRSTSSFVNGKDIIIYSKLSDENPKMTNIHDLYVYDINEEKETRLTFGMRANNPSVSNDGKKVVFVFQNDGTINIGLIDIDGKNFKRLTYFENGEQVYNPKFSNDDSFILFDYSLKDNRDIAKINVDGSELKFITNSNSDERNAVQSNDGRIIFSNDKTGIFNLYSLNTKTNEVIQLTNVIGGAFMPTINNDGAIAYSGYTADGFKIFLISKDEQSKVDSTKKYVWINNPPLEVDKPNGDIEKFNIAYLKNFNDNEIPEYQIDKYSGFFSKVSIIPFIRYDNYSTFNSGLDRVKPGVYLASSDILNRYSIFASASINRKMERDLFLQFEYKDKVPLFFNLGLRPEISLELYSVSRGNKVDLDFGIDSTFSPPRIDYKIPTEVTYNLLEFDIVAKHKIFKEGNFIETRFIFSQYTSTLNSFILPESGNTLYPTTTDKYFVGRNFQLKYVHESIIPTIDSDINPVGRKVELKYDYEFNRFNNENNYTVVDGILKPLYNDFKFHRIEINWKEYLQLFDKHTLSAQVRIGSILGKTVPDFFDFYLGGLVGMKSYPFYSISGNEIAWLNLTYRFPLLTNIDSQIGHIYIDKIYLSVYGDIGNAWNGKNVVLSQFKKGFGSELRIKLNSFYIFPTSLFFNAAYSFDKIERVIRNEKVVYGKEWNFYGGILFDFSL